MFVQAYINTAKEILEEYGGEEPFHFFLKRYFGANKKFGSRDRRHITDLCYCFFRLGKSLSEVSIPEKLVLGLFLCNNKKSILLQKLNSSLNEEVESSLDNKLKKIKSEYNFHQEDIFPFGHHVSNVIELNFFFQSFLIQPLVFLRIRLGNEKGVKKKLTNASIPYQLINDRCLGVEPATKLDRILEINKEAVIQDHNSQQVLNSLIQHTGKNRIKTAWDCCAASGGKTILLKDHFPDVELTVSDTRENILINLKKRLEEAGIRDYKKMLVDLSTSGIKTQQLFDLIICDAPCSGSGTWSRTPEQLYFFKENKIQGYASLQKKIVSNAIKNLKEEGFFLYITCSVFKKENEEVVQFLENELSLHLILSQYLKGYRQKADTLFSALFTL